MLHAWVRAGREYTVRGRRGDEHAQALGSAAVGAPADEINIVPTRRADSAGASSMIQSDSISVSDVARADKTSAGGGSCPDEAAVVLAVAVVAQMTRPEPTALHLMVSGTSSAPTGPQPRGRPRPAHRHTQASRRLGQAGERGRDGSWIIMTVESTSRLPVVAEMSRVRWPLSPTARSCGCLHRGSNA